MLRTRTTRRGILGDFSIGDFLRDHKQYAYIICDCVTEPYSRDKTKIMECVIITVDMQNALADQYIYGDVF